jgi:threonine dehydrogenase-like Zn-dependent dehydrogenase
MRALQFEGIGRLRLVDARVPQPGLGELLVRTGAAIICTSDVNELRTGIFGSQLPIIFGHEGAGTVAAVGSNVIGFAIGDRVATHPVHSCRQCPNCRAGMAHLCDRMRHFGLNMPGTFAEFYVCGAERARRVPRETPFHAVALAEPICVCLQALAQARVNSLSKLLFLGDGPFGVLMSWLARSQEIGSVTISGEHDFRLGFADAQNRINIRQDGAQKKLESLGPFDAAILAVGSAHAARQGLSLIRPKGRLVIFSAVNDPAPLDLLRVHIKELEIVGACNDEDRLDEAVARLVAEPQKFARLITHHFELEHYEQAFELAATGHSKALKVAFNFEAA